MHRLLDRLLVTLEVRLEAFALLEIARGSRLVFDGADAVIIHYVLDGSGFLESSGAPPVQFSAGSLIILPAGAKQAFRVHEGPAVDIDALDHCAMVKDGMIRVDATAGKETDLRVLCGSLMPTASGSFGLFDGLKAPLTESFGDLPAVSQVFELLRAEVDQPGLGARALSGALMKLPLVLLIRRHFALLRAGSPLLEGAEDERLSRAMAAIVEAPAQAHTVASLAELSGMSRSAFARAFTRSFQQSPMEFVAKARLHHAAELLRGTDLPVKVIAASIGFASRSHFSRAFRKGYGVDPQGFRRGSAPAIAAPGKLRGKRNEFAVDAEPDRA